jgi:zinc protease
MTRFLIALTAALWLSHPLQAQVEVDEITTPGGIDAWLVEEPSLPFVALELQFAGGRASTRRGRRVSRH